MGRASGRKNAPVITLTQASYLCKHCRALTLARCESALLDFGRRFGAVRCNTQQHTHTYNSSDRLGSDWIGLAQITSDQIRSDHITSYHIISYHIGSGNCFASFYLSYLSYRLFHLNLNGDIFLSQSKNQPLLLGAVEMRHDIM